MSSQLPTRDRGDQEAGSVMLYVVIGIFALLGLGSLGIDVGLAYNARTQAQAAADARALAAAAEMVDYNATPPVTLPESRAEGQRIAASNQAYPNLSLDLPDADLTYGDWNFDTHTLDTSVNLTDPDFVTAVEVVMRLDGTTANEAPPSVLSRALGREKFDVRTKAVAYLGWLGEVGPGVVELPIAIPCCELVDLKNPAPLNDPWDCEDRTYCDGDIPNECDLETYQPRDGGMTSGGVSCIQGSNTLDQTFCWTEYSTSSPAVNASDLKEIVDTGYTEELTYEDYIYLDSGEKVPVIREIDCRFNGCWRDLDADGIPETWDPPTDGVDTDQTGCESTQLESGALVAAPGSNWGSPECEDQIDSWVTVLPVVKCQDEDICAKGLPIQVDGFVCFEIREILVTPEKLIKGTFICPKKAEHQDAWLKCKGLLGTGGSGGGRYSVRADYPVLVR